jgi:polygalacturonase
MIYPLNLLNVDQPQSRDVLRKSVEWFAATKGLPAMVATHSMPAAASIGDGHGLSVGSYIHGPVHNIMVRDCVFNRTKAGLRIKSARDRGNVCENISLEDVTMTDVNAPVSIRAYYGLKLHRLDPNDKPQPVTKTTPLYRNIRSTNLTASGAEIAELPEQPAANIVFRNTRIAANEGLRVMNARGVQFIETTVTAKTGPPFLLSNATTGPTGQ